MYHHCHIQFCLKKKSATFWLSSFYTLSLLTIPKQPLTYVYSLYICLFWTFNMNGIMWYVVSLFDVLFPCDITLCNPGWLTLNSLCSLLYLWTDSFSLCLLELQGMHKHTCQYMISFDCFIDFFMVYSYFGTYKYHVIYCDQIIVWIYKVFCFCYFFKMDLLSSFGLEFDM